MMNALKYPEPSKYIIAFQCICALFLAFSLATFIHTYDHNKNLKKTLTYQTYREKQLDHLETKINKFEEISKVFSTLGINVGENLWHDMEAEWEDIPFEKLIYRLDSIYWPQNYFVLKSFEAHSTLLEKERDLKNRTLPSDKKTAKKTFTIKGWTLCRNLDNYSGRSF